MKLTDKHLNQVREYGNSMQTYLPYNTPTFEDLINIISDYIKDGVFIPDRLYGKIHKFIKKYYPDGVKFGCNTYYMDDEYIEDMADAVTAWVPMNDEMKEVIFMKMARICQDLPFMMPHHGDNLWPTVGDMYGEIRKIVDMI